MSRKPLTRASSRQVNELVMHSNSYKNLLDTPCALQREYDSGKHKKVLAHGKQIKTHLLCQHTGSKPIWGAGTFVKETETDILEQKTKYQKMIDRKIDRIFMPSVEKSQYLVKESAVPVKSISPKHRKVLSEGHQIKTHLVCQHLKENNPHVKQEKECKKLSNIDGHYKKNVFDTSSASNNVPIYQNYVVRSNLPSSGNKYDGRSIFAPVHSPEDVSIVDVRVPSLPSQKSSLQRNLLLPPHDCYSSSGSGRKRIRFEDELSEEEDNSEDNIGDLAQSANSRNDVYKNRKTLETCCQFCGESFESLQAHSVHPKDSGQFYGSHPSNFQAPWKCKYCSCYDNDGRCWAVDAFENSALENDIGVAQCKNCTSTDKFENNHGKTNPLPRKIEENASHPSVKYKHCSPKYQAGKRAHLYDALNSFDHQCVHQYHQNSRLFLEPTTPGTDGSSTCQLCGRTPEDSSSSNTNESDGPEGRSWRKRKVSFDVPRSPTVTRGSSVEHRPYTRARATRSLVSKHVCNHSLKSNNFSNRHKQNNQFSGSETRASRTSGGKENYGGGSRLSSCCDTREVNSKNRPLLGSYRSREPLFMLSVDPVLAGARACGNSAVGQTATSEVRDLTSANIPKSRRESRSSYTRLPKRNPAHSMALEDHI